MRKIACLACVAAVAASATLSASVFDDVKLWWKFDEGGADGTLAQTGDIHDCRDTSAGVPSQMCGPSNGPLWTNTTVRLPYRQKDVQCSALNFPVVTNASQQLRPTMVDIGNGAVNSDEVTLFARFCPGEQLYTATVDRFLYNNNFVWGTSKTNSYGNLFGIRVNGAKYSPELFIGQESAVFDSMTMEVGKWYDLAFSISVVTGTMQRVLCVLAGDEGVFYQTAERLLRREVAYSGTLGRIGGQGYVTSWTSATNGNNVSAKDFNGLIHEMALWDRALNLGEILDAFGRPEAPTEGDVFSDVHRWWKFDRDLDANGKVSADELRDVRKWGTSAAPAQGNPTVDFVTDGGPLFWRNMPVYFPARGVTAAADCLTLEHEYRTTEEGRHQILPARVRFADSAIAGDSTYMARICITKAYDFVEGYKWAYLFQSAFSYGSKADRTDVGGYQLGIITASNNTDTNFYPIIYGGKSSATASTLPMTTNTWYDVAYTISPQPDGKDHMTVAVADPKNGIRTWSSTMNSSQSHRIGKVLMLGGENDYRDWTYYTDATGKVTNANALKNFTGAIQQIALWRRALTTNEIATAFGYPSAMFGAGTADGSSGEFATAAEGRYDWTVGETWHDMAGTLDATHRTLSVRFTPPANWHGMDQGFHLVAGEVAGADAKVSLSVNGTSFGAQAVSTGGDAWWIVKGGAVRAGENVATLTISGTSPSLAIDKFEMLGSWGLVSGDGGEFSHEGYAQSKDYYVGDLDMAHVTRAVVSTVSNNRLHFWLPAWLAENYPFEFTFRTHSNTNACAAFEFIANGDVIHSEPNGLVNGERTITFAPGALKAGWNEIGPHFLPGGGAFAQFTHYTLRLLGPEYGTYIIFR